MIHALPGMGADRRMFPEPWGSLPGFKAHDWVKSAGLKSIRQLAEAMAESCGVVDGDVLVGCSLGGMVAAEITRLRKIPALFLVGSAAGKGEIKPWAANLHAWADKVPIEWLQFVAGKMPGLTTTMLAGADPDFIRRMWPAIFQWPGLGASETKVWRIHGRKDLLIPPPGKCDLLLGGEHLIAITHARECVAFVARHLE
ncbi:MAG TPA: alpha/beta fold hydrolase [Lacunisphaera sp.]|nr:alpha/beta fold hydrolase [Lacunisphaera sp.]